MLDSIQTKKGHTGLYGGGAMSSNSLSRRSLIIVLIFILTPLTPFATPTQSNWSGPSVADLGGSGGNTTITGFSIPEGETILDAWLEVGEDSDSDLGTGIVWEEDAQGKLNFSWGLWNSTTTEFFDGALSLDSDHSVGRINDFETLSRTLQHWTMGGTPGVWEVSDMLGIPGQLNGSARESSGGLIPIGAVTGRYIIATMADQSLPNGVHTWMESPDFYVPTVIDDFNLTFSHWHHMYTPSLGSGNADGVWVEMSTDGGQSWNYITPEGGYNNRINSAAPSPNGSGGANFEVWASPNATGWQQAVFNLDNHSGISNASTIRFRFVAWTDFNSTVQRPGWFIDNVNLTNSGADGGTWFHGNLTGAYVDGASSFLSFEVNLSNASGPIMLDYAVDFDLEGDIYDNFRWQWSLNNFSWNSFSADIPGFGVVIGGKMYVDDSNGWRHLSHPLPQTLAGNTSVFLRVNIETDNFPGTGYGGTTLNPPEGLFIDDVVVTSGTIGNQTTHLSLNFSDISDGGAAHGSIGGGYDEWQYLPSYGINGPSFQVDSFEEAPLLPEGWTIDTIRGGGWEFRSHNSTWNYGPDAPSNGSHYAGIEFGGVYQPDTWTHLISPTFNIPANSHARISFNQFVCAEPHWDGGVLYVSNDDGRNWIPYGMNEPNFYDSRQNMNPASEIYNLWAFDGSNSVPTCNGQRGTGVNKSWVTKQADVSQFSGQGIRLRFSFFTDQLLESDGWYIDDIGLYVDWFEEHGTWISDPIDTSRNGMGSIDIDATVPNGTWVRCTLLYENGSIAPGMENLSFPVIPLPGALESKMRIKLEMGTEIPQLTPTIHGLYLGAVSIFSARDSTNGWTVSPLLDLNKSSNNLTNPEFSTHSLFGPLIYGNNPLRTFELSGYGSGAIVTLLDERGIPFYNGALSNVTVQRSTPLVAYRVQIDLQPGAWLQSFQVKGRLLQPGLNVSVDIGNDGSIEWQFSEGNDGRGQLGWQDSLMVSNSRSVTTDGQSGGQNAISILIPDGAIVTGGLIGVQTYQQSVVVNLSIGGATLLTGQMLSNGPGLLVPLNSGVIQSINALVGGQWSNDERDWKQVPISLDATDLTEFRIYGINYILNENLSNLGPIISSAMNATSPENGVHEIPVTVTADAGGVSLWGGVEHEPLIVNEITVVPQTWIPDRTTVVTTEHTHLFAADGLARANLSLLTQTGFLITFSAENLDSGGSFSQHGGGGQISINPISSSVVQIDNGWQIKWELQTEWGWDDVDWIDVSAESWGINGEHLPPDVVRIGVSSKAVENDMEIDSWEVRGADNRLLSTRGSPSYPFEIASGSVVEVSGTVRFEDSNMRPSNDNFLVTVQVDSELGIRQVAALSGSEGYWNATVTLNENSGVVNLTSWILRPGPSGTPLIGASDETKDRTPVTLIIDANPPTLSPLMVHTPSGVRLADGNVWPDDRLLPISVEVTEIEAFGGPLELRVWREGIDDVDGDSEADEWEYSISRQITPMKAQGTVRVDFPAIDLIGNGELGKVSLYVTGTDLAGHPVENGGGPGLDYDMATITTQEDLPTILSLPSISLDRWGDNLLVGTTHEISFSLSDGNGINSLDNISVSLSTGDSRGDIWLTPLSGIISVNDLSPITPVGVTITELAAGSFNVAIQFRIGVDAPDSWNLSHQEPSISIVEHGQLLVLGGDTLKHLEWSVDGRTELILNQAFDLSPPGSGLVEGTLYLQPDDRFNFSGRLIHLANQENVTLDGEWGVTISMDDSQNEPEVWHAELNSGHTFTTTNQVPQYRWNREAAKVIATVYGGEASVPIGAMNLDIVIDSIAPVVVFPNATLSALNSNQMTQQLVTIQIHEAGGMDDSSLEMHWSFRRHGVEILDMHGISKLPLATNIDGIWTYSTRIDFDINHAHLLPGDTLVVWVVGSDLAGHSFVGAGSEGEPRMPQLRVIYFHPVISDLSVDPYQPTLNTVFSINGRVFNEGNDMGVTNIGLWTWQSSGEGGRYITLNETNVSLLPQQHSLFTFNVEAWSAGDLQLYIVLNNDPSNLTSVPVGLVREQSTSEAFLSSINSPMAIGFLILIISVMVMAIVISKRIEDDWDEDDQEDLDGAPPPPPWGLDDWPEWAGPPPEVITSITSSHEEE